MSQSFHYPNPLLKLIAHLRKLPGVGGKTAERFAFHLLDWSEEDLKKFSQQLGTLKEKIYPCSVCGCLKDGEVCLFCTSPKRDKESLCIVSSARDVYAIEETKVFQGLYHVIGGLLSPLEGLSVEKLCLESLHARLKEGTILEAILAFDSTLEGDATALFLKKKLTDLHIQTTRLAFGLPMGSSLDFVDYGTLEKAFTGRQSF